MSYMEKFTITLEYSDESESCFEVSVDGSWHDISALLCMITRGTLMASMAIKATCYNSDGFDVCSYIK